MYIDFKKSEHQNYKTEWEDFNPLTLLIETRCADKRPIRGVHFSNWCNQNWMSTVNL